MHITLETDYAIRIVDSLARRKNEAARMDAKTISEETGVPLRFALKILRNLVSGDIVRSFKGVYGGYELVKTPSEVSLYDVVEIVEGGYRFSRCLASDYDCSCKNNTEKNLPCAYQAVFGEITELVCRQLKQKTFQTLISAGND